MCLPHYLWYYLYCVDSIIHSDHCLMFSDQDKTCHFEMKLMDIDSESLGIPVSDGGGGGGGALIESEINTMLLYQFVAILICEIAFLDTIISIILCFFFCYKYLFLVETQTLDDLFFKREQEAMG